MAYYRINDISISGNTISNLQTNGDILLRPNGSGVVDVTQLVFDDLAIETLASATGLSNNDLLVMVSDPTGLSTTLKITGSGLRSSLLNQPAQLQFRQGTEAERLLVTPASGEPIWIIDTKKFFIGDGSTVGGISIGDNSGYAALSGAIFSGEVVIPSGSGNFNILLVNGTGVSISGHSHSISNITDFNSSVSGLLPTVANSGNNRLLTSDGTSTGINAESLITASGAIIEVGTTGVFLAGMTLPSIQLYSAVNESAEIIFKDSSGVDKLNIIRDDEDGENRINSDSPLLIMATDQSVSINSSGLLYNGTQVSVSGHTHTSANITDFNSAVSGLLPTISNSGNNRILTSDGTSTGINAENNFTYEYSSGVTSLLDISSENVNNRLRLVQASSGSFDHPRLDIRRNRNTIDSPSPLESGDHIGSIYFTTMDSGSDQTTAAQILAYTPQGLSGYSYSPTQIRISNRTTDGSLSHIYITDDGTFNPTAGVVVNDNAKSISFGNQRPTALQVFNGALLNNTEVCEGSLSWCFGNIASGVSVASVIGSSSSALIALPSGNTITNGVLLGHSIGSYRNALAGYDDNGSLLLLIGQGISYGHAVWGDSSNSTTSIARGINITPFAGQGTINTSYDIFLANTAYDAIVDSSGTIKYGSGIITNRYGIYQESANPNFLAGSLTINNGLSSPTPILSLGAVSGNVSISYAIDKQIQTLTLNGSGVNFIEGSGWLSSASVDVFLEITVNNTTTVTWTLIDEQYNPFPIFTSGKYLVLLRNIGTTIQGHYIGARTNSVSPTPTGVVSGGNSANWNSQANWNGSVGGNVTTVGSNGIASAYGTYDQAGNANEWTERIINDFRGIRGGSWDGLYSTPFTLSSSGTNGTIPSNKNNIIGFRIVSSSSPLNPLSLPYFVNIGDTGNSNDNTGYGSVNYVYQIAKYPVTNCEYATFLNAVASSTDTYALYSIYMNNDIRGGINRSGNSGSYTYSIKSNMGNKPVVWVDWFCAARYCNWLHNNRPTGIQNSSTTEDGAYTLNGAMGGISISRNVNAKYSIPTENEWYKAAYYKGGGTNAGYWDYATQSDTLPTSVSADFAGNGVLNGQLARATDYICS